MMGFPLKWPKPKPAIHGGIIPTSRPAPPLPPRLSAAECDRIVNDITEIAASIGLPTIAPVVLTPAERFRAAVDGLTVENLRGGR